MQYERSELEINNHRQMKSIPLHVAIIMDGNKRWSVVNNVSERSAYEQGYVVLKNTISQCIKYGIKYLTVYAFSSENWSRPQYQINILLELLSIYLSSDIDNLVSHKVRVRFIGDISKFSKNIQNKINLAEKKTTDGDTLNLTIALSYGGRDEIVLATKNIVSDVVNGKIKFEEIDDSLFTRYLYSRDLPDPDLLIRTSGEVRISNFLLWQMAYTELFFCEKFWPDFNESDFIQALENYNNRERRYGN